MFNLLVYLSWFGAAVVLVRKRAEIVQTLRAMPARYRVLIGGLLIGCALIPGPIDDLIVAVLIAHMGRKQS